MARAPPVIVVNTVSRAVIADEEVLLDHEGFRGKVGQLAGHVLPDERLPVPGVENLLRAIRT